MPEEPRVPTLPSEEIEPIFELGGPAFRLMQRVGIIRGRGPDVSRRSIAFIVITWIPLLIFSVLERRAIGPTPRLSLLLDFATYARFFIAVPLIFAAEAIVGPRICNAELRFIQGGIVQPSDHPALSAAIARARRRRDAGFPEVLFLALALFGAWFFTVEQLGGVGVTTWHSIRSSDGTHLLAAGVWYYFVAIPLVQFFLLRWLWRLTIWTLFLRDVSKLQLRLIPTHADRSGGLGFLGNAHVSLAIFPFALSCVFASELAFRIRFEGLDLPTLRSMTPLLIAYIIFVELVTFGPLLVLSPLMASVRLQGLRSYGTLVQQHNEMFHRKWIEGCRPAGEEPLGNPDMSSLVDLGSSFDVVRQMNFFPAGRSQLIQVAVIACLPGLPLTFLILPFAEVLRLLAGVVG